MVDASERPDYSKIDKVVHERARLMILTHLAGREDGGPASFTELKSALGFTSGNLSIQLKQLAESGYVSMEKRFRDNKPLTTVSLTPEGWKALEIYMEEMSKIINSLKK
jgi:DNA-binding HxlR family transcriptional regulator